MVHDQNCDQKIWKGDGDLSLLLGRDDEEMVIGEEGLAGSGVGECLEDGVLDLGVGDLIGSVTLKIVLRGALSDESEFTSSACPSSASGMTSSAYSGLA